MIIQQGAEAQISLEKNRIHKHRIKKSYRLSDLDQRLRKSRTKSEAKIINKLSSILPVPKILESDDKENIIMEFIEGKKLSENLEKLNYKKICRQIAENITKMHNQGIIHGDLTTSNMIYVEDSNKEKQKKVYFIDFGLSFHSSKIEDKAVDLHLIQQALEAKHFAIWEECWNLLLKHYNPEKKQLILDRIQAIEKRGRYRH
jgi:Kae1-associated kinase Bud32